jgi:DNA-binding NtrC family response regulator
MRVHMCSRYEPVRPGPVRLSPRSLFDRPRIGIAFRFVGESERTEQQDDSATAELNSSSLFAHVRVVHGERTLTCDIPRQGAIFGRDAEPGEADITFQDGRMSRRHARIERHPLAWQLVDLGSRNGGYVDGVAFRPNATVRLIDGAVIRLGDSIAVFRTAANQPVERETAMFPGDSLLAGSVRRRVRQLTRSVGHVLILGETGTGKERVARALRGNDPACPFVPQNCAELTRELSRSELFGHVRGAFSGAAATKPGLVEIAAGGVLFLDEIGELALDVQGDLLRFLEDGSYRPIGTTELRHSNARVLAATNVDLEAAVRKGTFRRDLLARLRASNPPLELPPLRDRREDILAWTSTFLLENGANTNQPWDAGAAECLLLYPWPENLREVRGLVCGLIASEPDWPLTSQDLPERFQAHRRQLRAGSDDLDATEPQPAELTREQIIATLERTQGRMRTAGEQLGVDRRKLYRLCEGFGIDFGSYRPGNKGDQ